MATTQVVGSRTVEPIVLDHLVLDGEAVRDADGNYLMKSQHGWEQHFAGSGKRLPIVREYIIAIKQLDERNDPALRGLLQDLQESALCTGTKIDYRNSDLPQGSGYLDVLVKDPAWRTALQDEVLHCDTTEAVDVLKKASGKRPYIWVPSMESRKSYPERAVWLGIGADRSDLDCGYDPIDNIGRSRGVREVGAAGARKKKTGSVYRNPAMTEEERLEERILEALSPFDQLKSPATTKLYNKLKQQALQDLKGLYKK